MSRVRAGKRSYRHSRAARSNLRQARAWRSNNARGKRMASR